MDVSPDPSLAGLDDCGCCAGVAVATPAALSNRDGLSVVAYRVGTYASFVASMHARLSGTASALSRLSTRDASDFTIALLDAWATTLDVLTFYQERIANESYLRTATERLSLAELARQIGYAPRPAIAAGTALAFTVDASAGIPPPVTIPAGVRVQSVPGPGETPHVFETTAAIEARPEWNALRPRLTAPQALSASASRIWLEGTDANVKTGDRLLIVTPNDRALRRIAQVTADDENKRTEIDLEPLEGAPLGPASSEPGVFAMRVKAAPFGHNAPLHIVGNSNGVPVTEEWGLAEGSEQVATLDAVYDQVRAGSWVAIDRPSAFRSSRISIVTRVTQVRTLSRAAYGISGRATQLTLEAPWLSLPFVLQFELILAPGIPPPLSAIDHALSQMPGPGLGSSLLNVRLFDLSLAVLRDTVVHAQSEKLTLSEQPVETAVGGAAIDLQDAFPAPGRNRRVVISGERVSGGHASEIATVAAAVTARGTTALTLERALANTYKRHTVFINANVAPATEGETVEEVLGSGDAAANYQEFTLRQPPLTFVGANTPDGAASTLDVRVNDVLWHEAATLHGRTGRDRVYVTGTDDDEKTTVQFGNGATGARLPTGTDNVRATYRKGAGSGGNVDADRVSLLMTRPLGVTGVTNPQAATGGADRESRDDVRTNAPLTVLTLDRVVSLRDYEDFARAFAGIAKALATWTWDGQTRGVMVTVAGANGAEVKETSDTYANLLSAMHASGDPHVPLRVHTYRRRLFRLTAAITRDPDFSSERVAAEVRTTLGVRFGFAARSFGEPVALSEVMAAIQAVPGVVGVDVDALFRVDRVGGSGLLTPLPAAVPAAGDGVQVAPAELLVLDEEGLQISVA